MDGELVFLLGLGGAFGALLVEVVVVQGCQDVGSIV